MVFKVIRTDKITERKPKPSWVVQETSVSEDEVSMTFLGEEVIPMSLLILSSILKNCFSGEN